MIYKESKQYRLPGYNYANDGFYFVTICAQNMRMFFGNVVNGQMILSKIGKIANQYWLEIPKHFPHARLHEYIVMPHHVHGILELRTRVVVGTRHGAFLQQNSMGMHPLVRNSLSSILNHFKGAVKKWCNRNNHGNFAWMSRFRDTVILHENALYNFRKYIINNPSNWELKKNNPDLM
ncbi:MAG: transposase [Patescibacteria group bacterium]